MQMELLVDYLRKVLILMTISCKVLLYKVLWAI